MHFSKNIYPDWFDTKAGGLWAITQNNNLLIIQPGHCPRIYDEANKIWVACRNMPSIKQTDKITKH